MKFTKKKIILIIILTMVSIGYFIPENLTIPVKGATVADWNDHSFWYEPWGKSGVHKGIDIFAKQGTLMTSASKGIVLYTGEIQLGGKVVIILGPKWRLHYYAHLNNISTQSFNYVNSQSIIGTVGDTGNAQGKPAHLHYSIVTIFPYLWRLDFSTQGWKKIFFLDPNQKLKD